MEEESKKKIVKNAVAAAAVTGVLVGGLFSSPGDLLHEASAVDRTAPPPSAQVMLAPEEIEPDDSGEEPEEDTSSGGGSGGGEDEASGGTGKSSGNGTGGSGQIANGLHSGIVRLPAAVRAVLGVPLWCLGTLMLHLLSGMWRAVLSPILSVLVGWLLTAALILLAAVIVIRTLFPDLPLKKILNKRTVLAALIGAALISAADAVLPLFVDGYGKYSFLGKLLASSAVLLLILRPFLKLKRRLSQMLKTDPKRT